MLGGEAQAKRPPGVLDKLGKKPIWASGWQGWQQKEDDLHVHVQVIFLFYGIEL